MALEDVSRALAWPTPRKTKTHGLMKSDWRAERMMRCSFTAPATAVRVRVRVRLRGEGEGEGVAER